MTGVDAINPAEEEVGEAINVVGRAGANIESGAGGKLVEAGVTIDAVECGELHAVEEGTAMGLAGIEAAGEAAGIGSR